MSYRGGSTPASTSPSSIFNQWHQNIKKMKRKKEKREKEILIYYDHDMKKN
jgi:hypothetical protein